MKLFKKWGFLLLLLVCGGVVMTATHSWAAAGKPLLEVSGWLVGKLEDGEQETEDALGEGALVAEEQNGEGVSSAPSEAAGQQGVTEEPAESGSQNENENDGADGSGNGGVGSNGGADGSGNGGVGGNGGADGSGNGSLDGSGGAGGSADGSGSPDGNGGAGESADGNGSPDGNGGAGEGGTDGAGNKSAGGTEDGNPGEELVPDGSGEPPLRAADQTVEDDYFSDAVFIGDSRMVGMYEYGNLMDISTFYVSKGLTIFKIFDSEIVEVPDERGKITVEEALSENQFAKIYLEVGINEMGTGDLERFLTTYAGVLERLQELQPDAIIYVQAIMKVTTERSNKGDYITNEGIEERNAGLAAMADNRRIFYLDVNPLVVDDTGGLNPDFTYDGVHLKGKHLEIWKNFLKEHAVLLD